MICYEVLVEAQSAAVADEFVAWMREEHGQDMLAVPGCLAYRVLRRSETTVACLYDYSDRDALDGYLTHRAEAMRGKGARFSGRIQISRQIVPIVAFGADDGARSHP